MRRAALLLIAAAVIAGCTPPLGPARPTSANWRMVAGESDRDRLRDWRTEFDDALARAAAAGHGDSIAAEGALLTPDAALGGPIPNGNFRCRTIKLGARKDGNRDFVAYPAQPCQVTPAGTVQAFAVLSGAQRPSGFLYPGDRLRGVFLGGLSLGDEDAAMRYGVDPDRDLVGWVERIGDARWRIILPRPRLESTFDVIELVPTA